MTEEAYLVEVGTRVRVARARPRMTQEELAARAGVSRVSLGSIERGRHPATVRTVRRLAAALSVSMGELLDEEAP